MTRNDDSLFWPRVSKVRLASWRKLKTKKGRRQSGQIIVEGVRLVGEALASGCRVEALIAAESPEGATSARRVLAQAGDWEGTKVTVPLVAFNQLSDTLQSCGIAAVVSWVPGQWDDLPALRPRWLLFCDRLSDPGNLGTLIRTAAGLGLHAVLVGPNSAELSNPKTVRATAGALFRIPVIADAPIKPFIDWCRTRNYEVCVADRSRGRSAISVLPSHAKGWALVIGGETSGLDPAWDTESAQWLSIPMHRGVESFNAAVAGAILLDRLCMRSR